MKKILAFWLLILTLVSCARQEGKLTDKLGNSSELVNRLKLWKKNTTFSKDGINYQNNDNPYEYVGVMHNNLLTKYKEQKDSLGVNSLHINDKISTSISELYSNYSKYVQVDPNQIDTYITDDAMYFYNNPTLVDENQYENQISQVLNRLVTKGLTPIEREIENVFFQKIKNADNAQYVYSLCKYFETEILESNELNDTQKSRQLSFFSVVRHSTFFWDQTFEHESDFSKKPFWKKLVAGIADGVGALSGLLFTNPVTATVVGGAVSAIASELVNEFLEGIGNNNP